MKFSTKNLAIAGVIGALYAALTILLAPISYGPVQVRIAEALTILPFFFPQAIWGLFFGCMAANIYGGYGLVDIFAGSFITLLAALTTYWLRRFKSPWLAPIPPILYNAFGVSIYVSIFSGIQYWVLVWQIGLGQLIACYGLGMLLLFAIKRRQHDF